MIERPGGQNTRRKRTNKSCGRRLRFECCEQRLSLTATPASEVAAALHANLETTADELELLFAASNSIPSTNIAATNLETLETPVAVETALWAVLPGEGGFERLRVTHGTAMLTFDRFADFIVSELNRDADTQVRGNHDSNAPLLDDGATHIEAWTARDQVFVLIDSIDMSDLGVDLSTSHGKWQLTDSPRPATNLYNAHSPPMAKVEIAEVEADEPNAGASELAQGEGEFVRLTASSHAERIEQIRLAGISAMQVAGQSNALHTERSNSVAAENASHTAPVLTQQVYCSTGYANDKGAASRESRPIIVSAAWDLDLTPVRRVALAFDTADRSMDSSPNTSVTRSPAEAAGDLPTPPGGEDIPQTAAPTGDVHLVPPSDSVSLLKTEKSDDEGTTSRPYVLATQLHAMIAGLFVIKDRWQQLQPRDETCVRHKQHSFLDLSRWH